MSGYGPHMGTHGWHMGAHGWTLATCKLEVGKPPW